MSASAVPGNVPTARPAALAFVPDSAAGHREPAGHRRRGSDVRVDQEISWRSFAVDGPATIRKPPSKRPDPRSEAIAATSPARRPTGNVPWPRGGRFREGGGAPSPPRTPTEEHQRGLRRRLHHRQPQPALRHLPDPPPPASDQRSSGASVPGLAGRAVSPSSRRSSPTPTIPTTTRSPAPSSPPTGDGRALGDGDGPPAVGRPTAGVGPRSRRPLP